MCDVSITSSGDVERAEVEVISRMPGFERLADESSKMVGKRWVAVYTSDVAGDMAVFSIHGSKSRQGFVFQARKTARGADVGARSLAAAQASPPPMQQDFDDIDDSWAPPPTTSHAQGQPHDAAAALRQLVHSSATSLPAFTQPPPLPTATGHVAPPAPKKHAAKPPQEPRPSHLLHIPPRPSLVRSTKTHLPAKMSLKALRDLNSGYQYFHVRAEKEKRPFPLEKTVRLDDRNKQWFPQWQPEGAANTPVKLLTSVGIRWVAVRPGMADLKRMVSKRAPLLKCDVRIPKKSAVMYFKTQVHAEAALAALEGGKTKSPAAHELPSFTLLSEDEVPTFIKGA